MSWRQSNIATRSYPAPPNSWADATSNRTFVTPAAVARSRAVSMDSA